MTYLEARDKAFRPHNIESAWVKAGILPWNPALVIKTLPTREAKIHSSSSSCSSSLISESAFDQSFCTPSSKQRRATTLKKITAIGALTPSRAASHLPRIMRGIKKISKSVARLNAEVRNTLKLNEELLEG